MRATRQALVVAGMHRSGTSAVARVLSLLGAALPARVMPPQESDNSMGYWEPLSVVRAHNALFDALGTSWDDLRPVPRSWFGSAEARAAEERLTDLLREEYGDAPLFVVKDPRIARLVPLWLRVLARLGAEPLFVVPFRHPLEVAASLKERNGLLPSQSLLLWLLHLLEVEAETRGRKRCFVDYGELLGAWRPAVDRIGERLGVSWPRLSDETAVEVERFLVPALRRHAVEPGELEGRPDVVSWVKEAYAAALEAAAGEPDEERFDAVAAAVAEGEAAFGTLLAELRLRAGADAVEAERRAGELGAERDRLAAEAEGLRADGDRLRAELAELGRAAAAERRRLEEEAGEVRAALEASQRDMSLRLEELSRRKGELTHAAAELSRARGEAERLEAALREREQELWVRDERLLRLEAETADARAEAERLTVDGERLRADLDAAAGERARLEEAVGEAAAERERLASEGAALRSRLEAAAAERTRSAEEARRLGAQLRDERAARARAEARLAAAEADADRLRAALPWWRRRKGAPSRERSPLLAWLLWRPPHVGLRRLTTYLALRRSGRFDAGYYCARNRDVARSGMDPLMHYVEHGAREGRDPSPSFSARRYVELHPELAGTDENPLLHAIRAERRARRSPPRASARPRTRRAAASQLASWVLRHPTRERLGYVRTYRALRRAGTFDGRWYLARYPDVDRSGLDPLMHYVEHGMREGRDPGPAHALAEPHPVEPAPLARPDEEAAPAEERGDDTLVVGGRARRGGRPFPRGDAEAVGATAAIAQLEWERGRGAAFLRAPEASVAWLRRRPALWRHLQDRYPRDPGAAGGETVFDLRPTGARRPWPLRLEALLEEHRLRFGRDPAVLDWESGLGLEGALAERTVFVPAVRDGSLPYLDGTIDAVVVPAGAGSEAEARRVARGLVVRVDSGNGRVELEHEWLGGGGSPPPSVSIVIPTFDAAGYLDACLRALWETLPPALEVEVVVVDDASGDETPDVLARWSERQPRLRTLRNRENAGFLDSCNAGARAAGGDVLVFLNNDTIPLGGWLAPLLETLREQPEAGAVGGRLLYPDGSLQEAGALLFRDASGANVGKGTADPDEPLFTFLREVDYCSGALLATPRELFAELGGFDERFRPAYYEDADYCFRVREVGRRVLYQPRSTIVHAEGGTGGTDVAAGVKRHQAVNRERFAAVWEAALADAPERPRRYDAAAWLDLVRHVPRPRPVRAP